MKYLIIPAIVAGSVLLLACRKEDTATVERAREGVAISQVIGYASTDRSTATNIFLKVTEIWKGSEQASQFGVTNGMTFSEDGYFAPADLPEGAVVLFSFNTTRQISSEQIIWVRSGRIARMTVQDFKTKIGL